MTTERSPGPHVDGGAVSLHDRTADRLLAGTLGAADVPPGYEGVAALVRAATGPATADELVGEEAAVALMAGAVTPAPPAAPVVPPGTPSTAPPRPAPVPEPSRRWGGRGARVAAVAVAVLVGAGGGKAALVGGEKRPPATSAEPALGAPRRATVQGTEGPPLAVPTTTVPPTVAAPPSTTPPATSPPPPAVAAPAAPAPNVPPVPAPAPPPTPGAPPTTAPPLPEECKDVDRLPAGMREGLDRMARGFGFPSFAEMCRAGAQHSSGSSTGWGGASWRRR
ncbi:MAG TPA: hypothetical protein VHG90_05430 [Acidimicrobiales bacterium]|nr:hypothetical protein [Acidimicrobiales bacterium]